MRMAKAMGKTRSMVVTSAMVAVLVGTVGMVGSARAGGEVSVGAGVLPGGSFEVMMSGQSAGASMDTGFLVTGTAGSWLSRQVRLAATVALVPSVRTEADSDDASAARMLSPGVRVDGLRALGVSGGLYAFGAVGFSHLFLPGSDHDGNGVMVSGGIGGRFQMSPELDGFVEAGYVWSTHRVVQRGNDPRVDIDYFLLSAGLALDL